MYCNKCGKEVEDIHNFCTNCGNKFLDGKLVRSVNAGKSITVDIEPGNHRVAFDLWSGNGQYDINIGKEGQTVKVILKLGMGLLTSKPQLVSITTL